MRKLNTADVFAMARIIRASGVREELREMIHRVADQGLSMESVGIEGVLVIVEAVAEKKAEHAMYEALSGPFEVAAEEIAAMELDALIDSLEQLHQENDLQRFFGFVSRILGRK